jgi:signal transduction histidine kinase
MNRLYQGTGLGLSVTKKFIELMNGKINVQSEVNKGTTFTITFPET